jgi:2'-5' RNA ligase
MKYESFEEIAGGPALRERYFFALRPPLTDARRAAVLAEQLGAGWKVQAAKRLHVTLAITGDFDGHRADVRERLVRAGERIAVEPFLLTLDMQSISHRSAALRPAKAIKGLTALHRAIRAQWPSALVPMRGGWSFSPHMTLAYREGNPPSVRPVTPFEWQADRVVLIRSLIGRTQHETLGDWPLRAAQYDLF